MQDHLAQGSERPWIHLHYKSSDCVDLCKAQGIPESALELLLSPDPRPRLEQYPHAWAGVLRFLNLNKGSAPEDMVSLRFWLDANKLITFEGRSVKAVQKVQSYLEQSSENYKPLEILCLILRRMPEPLAELLQQWDEQADLIEQSILRKRTTPEVMEFPTHLRRRILMLRRNMLPQRDMFDAVEDFYHQPSIAPNDPILLTIQNIQSRWQRLIQDLEHLKDRARFMQEELQKIQTRRNQRHIAFLTIAGSILVPWTLVTGLFGMNVGGIPLANHPWGFGFIALSCVLGASGALWILLRRGWF